MAASLPGGARPVIRRGRIGVVIAVFALAVVGCERREQLTPRPITVTRSVLLHSSEPAWSALAADLDRDGAVELVLAGHRSLQGPGYCRLDGPSPCALRAFLGRAPDRHDCVAGDIDADGDLDMYCTAGAERGSGKGSNEVWMQVSPMRFENVPDALGAREESSRGRLAAFLDFNGDAWPDLVSTAWGTRVDGGDNRSKLWINREGHFVPADSSLPEWFGARWLSIADVNADGFDDIIGSPIKAGLWVLLNRRGEELETLAIGAEKDWYWDAQFLPETSGQAPLMVSTGGRPGDMFVEITELTPTLGVESRRRIDCSQSGFEDDRDMYCGRLLLHDADGDGKKDILVSRHLGWRHEDVLGDAPDLLIFGPDFREFSNLPVAQQGAGENLIATDVGVVQINAGKSWPGSVSLLQFRRQ